MGSSILFIIAPLDVVDTSEDEKDKEGECHFYEKDTLIVVNILERIKDVVGCVESHDLNYFL